MLRIQSICAELFESLPVKESFEILVVHLLDLVDLVGSAEAVEEMDKRNAALDGCQMSDAAKIHDLLHAS